MKNSTFDVSVNTWLHGTLYDVEYKYWM